MGKEGAGGPRECGVPEQSSGRGDGRETAARLGGLEQGITPPGTIGAGFSPSLDDGEAMVLVRSFPQVAQREDGARATDGAHGDNGEALRERVGIEPRSF